MCDMKSLYKKHYLIIFSYIRTNFELNLKGKSDKFNVHIKTKWTSLLEEKTN